MKDQEIVLVKRKSDGKYLRGSKYFTWVRSKRFAARISKAFIIDYEKSGELKVRFGIQSIEDLIFEELKELK